MTWATRPVGDRGVLVDLPDNPAALRVARALTGRAEFVEVVPGHRTVLLTWAGEEPPQDLDERVEWALTTDLPPAAGRRIEIPVVYDGADLDEVAQLVQLSPEEVVARHTAADYVAAFIGFAPGFAYLLGGDELLTVPRRPHPRKRVAAGSVAIAGPYSGVYPRDTPGGWRLLGRTSVSMFDATRERPALLASGDLVRFVPA